jgi:hypothetical protein
MDLQDNLYPEIIDYLWEKDGHLIRYIFHIWTAVTDDSMSRIDFVPEYGDRRGKVLSIPGCLDLKFYLSTVSHDTFYVHLDDDVFLTLHFY